MNTITSIESLKAEKAKAIKRYRRVASLLRLVEILVLVIMVYKFWVQIPATARALGDRLRVSFVAVLSPPFVFVVGNAIIIALLLNSSGQSSSSSTPQIYIGDDKFINVVQEKDGHNNNVRGGEVQVKKRESGDPSWPSTTASPEASSWSNQFWSAEPLQQRAYSVDQVSSEEEEREGKEDQMSSEEFRRRVEDFIARQQRFSREERVY